MAEYDGEIRIKADIDTNEFNKQASKLTEKLTMQNLALEKQALKVKALREQYDNLVKGISKTTEETSIEKALIRAQREVDKLTEKYKLAKIVFGREKENTPVSFMEDIKNYEKALERTNRLNEKLKVIRENPMQTESVKKLSIDIKEAALQSSKLEKSVDNLKGKLDTLSSRKSFIGMFDSFKSQIDEAKQKVSSLAMGIGNYFTKFTSNLSLIGKRILNIASSAFVFNVISAGFREISKSIGQFISQDNILSDSLSRIKFNLLTAFAPIYQSILPMLRAFAGIIENITLKLSAFLSLLFGQSFERSQAIASSITNNSEKSSKALNKQAKKLKEVGKEAKKASNSLASFDKIEVLNIDKKLNKGSSKDPYGGGIGSRNQTIGFLPTKADVKDIEFMSNIIDRLKSKLSNLDFSRAINSLNRLKEVLVSYGRNAGEDLLWLYDNVLSKFINWTGNELLPRFFDLLAVSLQAVQPIVNQVRDDLKWLWDEFLSKLAEWTGIQIVSYLDSIIDCISNLGKKISNNKPLLEFISAFLIGLAGAALAVKLVGLIKNLALLTKGFLSFGAALLANPWTWAVVGIGALIAAIILITKHWDEMEQYFGAAAQSFKDAIQSIRDIFSGFVQNLSGWIDFIGGLLSGDWNRMWKGAGNIVLGAVNTIIGALNAISNIMNTVINSVIGGINFMVDKINGIGFDLPGWLGGKSFRLNIPKIPRGAFNSPTIPKLPRLATGAVLEGGNPMLAYLNDQPKGQTNIEAPLETMVEAFNRSLSERGNSNIVIEASGDVGQLISFLKFKLSQEDSRVGNSMVKGDVWI